MFSFLSNPSTTTVLEVVVVYIIFSAAVQSLPHPSSYGGVWYKAVYSFLTILSSDFKSFASTLPTSGLSTVLAKADTTSGSSPSGE